jgi:hypothetical protein
MRLKSQNRKLKNSSLTLQKLAKEQKNNTNNIYKILWETINQMKIQKKDGIGWNLN